MADEQDKLAEALEKIVTSYEGDPDDPVWKQAKEALASMKPKSMFLVCPKCGLLHVDVGELVTTAHSTHKCLKCDHKWKPHAYPTVGVSVPGMEAVEATAFLRYWAKWLAGAKQQNPSLTATQASQIQRFVADGWKGGRDFWLQQEQVTKAPKAKAKKKKRKSKAQAKIDRDPAIMEMIEKGQVTWDDVDGLGHDPADYGMTKPTKEDPSPEAEETPEELAEELGIDFGLGTAGDIDEDTGIQL